MIIGNAASWLNKFRGYDDRFVPRVIDLTKEVIVSLGENPIEDVITINLIEKLVIDPIARQLFEYIEYQFEPTSIDKNGVAMSLGKIDLAAHIVKDRKTYLAYECKRLNVSNGQTTASLATLYVKDGMTRFVTEQYAEGMPVGGMLGYVMDGNTNKSLLKVLDAIDKNAKLVCLNGTNTNLGQVTGAPRFSSQHIRPNSGTAIELRHTLVPCV